MTKRAECTLRVLRGEEAPHFESIAYCNPRTGKTEYRTGDEELIMTDPRQQDTRNNLIIEAQRQRLVALIGGKPQIS